MLSNRISIEKYFIQIAQDVSLRGTCIRMKVGCVLVDSMNHILSTGYNGPAIGQPHCIDIPCPGAKIEAGRNTNTCDAIHSEANALLQCSDVQKIVTAYITHSPCRNCIKLLLNTSCQVIIYKHLSSGVHTDAINLWIKAGRLIEQVK